MSKMIFQPIRMAEKSRRFVLFVCVFDSECKFSIYRKCSSGEFAKRCSRLWIFFHEKFKFSACIPGAFSGAAFHGGYFNITINTSKSQNSAADQSLSSTCRHKRIKRIFESPDDDNRILCLFIINIVPVVSFVNSVIFFLMKANQFKGE